MGTLAKKLQAKSPPQILKVIVSKKIPLTGKELIAFEEEKRLKCEAEREVVPMEAGGQFSAKAEAVTFPVPLSIVEPGGAVPVSVDGMKCLQACLFLLVMVVFSVYCVKQQKLSTEVVISSV